MPRLIEVTAPTQEIATSIAGIVRHQALHLPIPEWSGLITALACPTIPRISIAARSTASTSTTSSSPTIRTRCFRWRWSTGRRRHDKEIAIMTTLAELARLIRSKNAGPFELTFDIMFDDARHLRARQALRRASRAKRSPRATACPPSEVKFFYCDNALAIKASIPRPYFQGDLCDSDGHGGQQYAPLMDIEIP